MATQAVYTLASGTITGSTGGTPSGVIPTPIETIEEFKVATANQTADFNGSGGGQVQMVTKRGTTQFHGSGYEYFLSTYFSANNWKNNHTPSGGLALYAASQELIRTAMVLRSAVRSAPSFLGGKTYFFFNYEGRRFPQATTLERTVPVGVVEGRASFNYRTAGVYQAYNSYNLNPVDGEWDLQPAVCPAGACDPRGIGLNPIVNQIWKFMPATERSAGGRRLQHAGLSTSTSAFRRTRITTQAVSITTSVRTGIDDQLPLLRLLTRTQLTRRYRRLAGRIVGQAWPPLRACRSQVTG